MSNKKYEAVFILDERRVEDGGETFSNEVASQVNSLGGHVVKKESMGRRQFARAINKKRAGIYWDFVLELPPAQVDSFKDRYRLDSTVIRMQVFLYEEPPAAAKSESAEKSS